MATNFFTSEKYLEDAYPACPLVSSGLVPAPGFTLGYNNRGVPGRAASSGGFLAVGRSACHRSLMGPR